MKQMKQASRLTWNFLNQHQRNQLEMCLHIITSQGSIKNGNEEMKRDLRSRGLCLVPLSCLSYVTYGGGNIWATP